MLRASHHKAEGGHSTLPDISEDFRLTLPRTDRQTQSSTGLATSSSGVGWRDCAQLSALKEHHSACQHVSTKHVLSTSSEVQSNFYIGISGGGTPGGMPVSGPPPLHPSLSGKRCHLIALPSLVSFPLILSFNVGTRPDTNEDWLLSLFCRCGVFLPSSLS